MKTVTRRFCTLIAMAMVFTFAACQPEPDPDKDKKDLVIPAELQDTIWTHSPTKDKISFEKESITIEPANGTAVKFSLLDTEPNDQIKQVILFFNKEKTNDTITYKKNDDSIAVNFKSTLTSSNDGIGWKKGDDDGSEPLSNFEFSFNEYAQYTDWEAYDVIYVTNVYLITNYLGNNTDIIIPSKGPNGSPVIGVCTKFVDANNISPFEGKTVNSITFPDSIKILERNILTNHNMLTKVTIPHGITVGLKGQYQTNTFPGNLDQVYIDSNLSKGTYTRTLGSNNWTRISD